MTDSVDKLQALIRGDKTVYENFLTNHAGLTDKQKEIALCAKNISILAIEISVGFVKSPAKHSKTIADAQHAQQKTITRIDQWVKRKKLRKRVTTIVSGIDTKTGKVVTRIKRSGRKSDFGKCAEDLVVEALGGNKQTIKMTKAMGFRGKHGWKEIPVCSHNCQKKFTKSQFVDDITWEPGGAWDAE